MVWTGSGPAPMMGRGGRMGEVHLAGEGEEDDSMWGLLIWEERESGGGAERERGRVRVDPVLYCSWVVEEALLAGKGREEVARLGERVGAVGSRRRKERGTG